MGLADTLRNAGTTIMNALDDVPKNISYYSVTTGAYNPSTDALTKTETLIPLKGVKYKAKVETKDKTNTELTQTKILIAGQAFGSVKPKEDDYMVIESERYEIVGIYPAPSEAVYVFVVRAV